MQISAFIDASCRDFCMSRLDVELLLAHVLGIMREELFCDAHRELTSSQMNHFSQMFLRRLAGEPLAYILSKKEFYGLEFFVDPRVLIPRPETELLVEKVFALVCRCFSEVSLSHGESPFRILDLGTGCGNIAISLAFHFSTDTSRRKVQRFRSKCEHTVTSHSFSEVPWNIIALDNSKAALEVCAKNVQRYGLESKISLVHSDLLDNCEDSSFDIIVANLPYIGTKKHHQIFESTLKYEPHSALFGGEDGLDCYRRLFEQIVSRRCFPRYLVGEIGFSQGQDMIHLVQQFFPDASFQIEKDYSGLDRMFVILFSR